MWVPNLEDVQEILGKVESEFNNSGGGLSLSFTEFTKFFDLENEIVEVIFQKLLATGRYQLSEHTDLSTGELINRLQIHEKYLRNYWLLSVLDPTEAQALLELGTLFKTPFNSRIKNLEIEDNHLVKLTIQEEPFHTLPSLIEKFECLKSLKIHGCKLSSLSDTIGNLTQLKVLDL